MANDKLRCLTGIKSTGVPHIGNYLGAIRPALDLARSHETFLFIADLHALTTARDPKRLTEETYSVAATWLACGLDPERTVFYKQTDVPQIATLSWILSCFTPMGLLNRSHSVKDARAKGAEDINLGLFSYPVLMAADILLYDADVVPVGKDQKQHLEICQEIARKINHTYGGEVLKIPKALIDDTVMTVPGLDGRKMSKSYDNTIPLFSTDKKLKKTINKGLVTATIALGDPLPTDSTVFELSKLFAGEARLEALRRQYASGRREPDKEDSELDAPEENFFGWGHAKAALSEVILEELGAARAEYTRLMDDLAHIRALLERGAQRAQEVAEQVLARVTDATGLVR